MYLSDIFTIAVSLAGLPAVSFPCGATPERLPLGAQLIGRHFDEGRLLAMVAAFEQASGQGRLVPAL